MQEHSPYLGICTTCAHAAACGFRRDPDRPALQCEEFEGGASEQAKVAGSENSAVNPAVSETEAERDDDSGRYSGLCVSCDERKTCALRAPEGGVWHCEEYR